jgi:predicted nucleotide-binding protein
VSSLAEYLAHISYAINILAVHVSPPETQEGVDVVENSSTDTSQTGSETTKGKSEKPRAFIGCSVEGLRYAKIIQLQLSYGANTTIWNQGVFGLSRGTLETLVAERHNYDYAILVLTPDDTLIKRDIAAPMPRDNVIFELGLFMGALGRENVFMVVVRGTNLPTDLAGITPALFDASEEVDLVSALGPITTQLEIAMNLI